MVPFDGSGTGARGAAPGRSVPVAFSSGLPELGTVLVEDGRCEPASA
jgi:hypothetical protein